MLSTIIFERGSVVVVEVRFSNGTGAKPRPALVISPESFHRNLPDVIVCPISSQPRFYSSPEAGDCPIEGWRRIGLRHPSTVRVSKIVAVDKRIIKRSLGPLSKKDLAEVTEVIRTALELS